MRPRLGVDTDERTIPHEVGWIGGAVHLDKGCYRGQETVARVHNLGKPPRMLVLLHLDGSVDRPATGDPVLAGGRAVGRLGTVVEHVDLGPIALALLKRGIPADTALSTGTDAEVATTIDPESLPAAGGPGGVEVGPATTLVAKKLKAMVLQRSVEAGGVDGAALEKSAALIAPVLRWDAARQKEEVAAYEAQPRLATIL